MTIVGKILVLINVGISLLMATWAMAVYTNRIDWSNTPPKEAEGIPAGELKKRQDEVARLWKEWAPADQSRSSARRTVADRESRRVGDRDFYAREMYHLWSGATKDDPARTVVFVGGGVALVPDPKRPGDKTPDRPQLAAAKDRAGNPLRALGDYVSTEDDKLKQLVTVLADHHNLLELDKLYTVKRIGEVAARKSLGDEEARRLAERVVDDPEVIKLVGGKEVADKIEKSAGRRGLQNRLVDERVKRAEVLEEHKLVRPLLINTLVESELIVKRHRALKKRVDELMGIKVAGRRR